MAHLYQDTLIVKTVMKITIHTEGRECGMGKYELNLSRYIGLLIVSFLIEIHLGGMGNFLTRFLLFFSAGLISMERME